MNKFSFFAMVLLSLMIAGCGGKKGGGGSGNVLEGYLDMQGNFTVGATPYILDPASYTVINQAIAVANQRGLQPQMINGRPSYRARLTGSVLGQQQQPYNAQPMNPMYPPTYNGGMGQQRLTVHSAELY